MEKLDIVLQGPIYDFTHDIAEKYSQISFINQVIVSTWKEFEHNGSYLLTADVARGDGKDYSVFHILDIKNMEQVAEYKGQLTTKDYVRQHPTR